MSGIETGVSKAIKDYVNMTGGICKRVPSGKIILSTYNKFGKKTFRSIQMEEKGTTDLVVDYRGTNVWVEVKKDKETYEKWLRIEEKFDKTGVIAKTNETEKFQILEKRKIVRKGGNYILTYSLQDFIMKYNELLG